MSITLLSHHEALTWLERPMIEAKIPAGWPSPADDYVESGLDLNEYLIRHPAATFYCRVSGYSMESFGILDGCLLVVDRAIKPFHGAIILAVIDGEFTCKQWDARNKRLVSGNSDYPPMAIKPGSQLESEGVVIHAINSYVCAR